MHRVSLLFKSEIDMRAFYTICNFREAEMNIRTLTILCNCDEKEIELATNAYYAVVIRREPLE